MGRIDGERLCDISRMSVLSLAAACPLLPHELQHVHLHCDVQLALIREGGGEIKRFVGPKASIWRQEGGSGWGWGGWLAGGPATPLTLR